MNTLTFLLSASSNSILFTLILYVSFTKRKEVVNKKSEIESGVIVPSQNLQVKTQNSFNPVFKRTFDTKTILRPFSLCKNLKN